jgi:hypothetical protein
MEGQLQMACCGELLSRVLQQYINHSCYAAQNNDDHIIVLKSAHFENMWIKDKC